MTITSTQSKIPASVTNIAVGRYLDDAGTPDAMTITLGFTPRYVLVVNITDLSKVEKYEGMAAATTLKTATAGDITAGADSAILINSMGFVFLKALTIQNKQYSWLAIG